MSVIFFKCETTGLNPDIDRIHKIAAVVCDTQLNVVSKFIGFANPGARHSQWTITDEKLQARADKSGVGDLLFRFNSLLRDLPEPRTLVAHSENEFDFVMLETELMRCGTRMRDWVQLDTVNSIPIFMMFEQGGPRRGGYSLDEVAERLADLPPRRGSHDSLNDAAVLYICCRSIKGFFLSRLNQRLKEHKE